MRPVTWERAAVENERVAASLGLISHSLQFSNAMVELWWRFVRSSGFGNNAIPFS